MSYHLSYMALQYHHRGIENALLVNGYVFAGVHTGMIWNHLRPIQLFDLSQCKGKPTEEERQHVRACPECKTVIAVSPRQFPPDSDPITVADIALHDKNESYDAAA